MLRTDFFSFVAKTPKIHREIHPHFPIGPKMEDVKMKQKVSNKRFYQKL